MTLFHFANCVVLAYAPYFIAYKYSNISDYTSIWKCVQASLFYFLTQFLKMMTVATFFPTSGGDSDVETFNLTLELIKNSVDFLDVIGLHLAISYFVSSKGPVKFFTAGLGWAAAHSLSNYFIGFFIGARTAGFKWIFVQTALESNIALIFYILMATLVWLFNRVDLPQSTRRFVSALIVVCVYHDIVYQLFSHLLLLRSWTLLGAKAGFVSVIFASTLSSYATIGQGATNSNYQKCN